MELVLLDINGRKQGLYLDEESSLLQALLYGECEDGINEDEDQESDIPLEDRLSVWQADQLIEGLESMQHPLQPEVVFLKFVV